MKGCLKLDIHGYWRAGTGRGGGALLDERSHRNSHQLPVLPGRTIKGLLRDAVWRFEQWNSDHPESSIYGITERWFGTRLSPDGSPAEDDMNDNPLIDRPPASGSLRVSNAEIEPHLREYLMGLNTSEIKSEREKFQELQSGFFNQVYATAIEGGKYKDKSLRAMEVTIPMQLYASLSIDDANNDDRAILEKCLPLIRSLGSSRTRGLGRVTISLLDEGEK